MPDEATGEGTSPENDFPISLGIWTRVKEAYARLTPKQRKTVTTSYVVVVSVSLMLGLIWQPWMIGMILLMLAVMWAVALLGLYLLSPIALFVEAVFRGPPDA